MGCHVTKNADSDKKSKECVITNEMLEGIIIFYRVECKVDEDVKSRISVYNQALDKM